MKVSDPPSKPSGLQPTAPENPLPGSEDTLPKEYQRTSHELLHESIMRAGGQPFGTPLGPGVTTLTQKTVRRFRKRGHFFLSIYEQTGAQSKNPFTRAGASNMMRDYPEEAIAFARDPTKKKRPWWKRLLGLR